MLPVVDKPLIQYAAEEAIAAGATELIFITGRNKRSIADHFDKAYELEAELEAAGKQKLLDIVHSILPKGVSCVFIRQSQALGLGHAVLCAKPVVGDEPFSVLLADDLLVGDVSITKQMVEMYEQQQCSILGIETVAPEETSSYGVVDAIAKTDDLLEVKGMVEKPKPEEAPSNLAVVGRYVLSPRIFDCLEHVKPGKGGEIQLTDGISALMQYEKVMAYRYKGKRYDCGSKLGFMQANVELGLKHPEIAETFKAYLQSLSL
jgi:UTP--glucose-1-phosphate uridylyltransferase